MIKDLIFNFKGTNFIIKPPKVGNIVDIEVLKSSLSKGQYRGMISSMTLTSEYALTKVEIESYFQILMPKEFWKKLGETSLDDLSIDDFNELKDAYIQQFVPWFQGIITLMKGKDDKKDSETV